MSVSNNLYYAVLAMDAYNRAEKTGDSVALLLPGDSPGAPAQIGVADRLNTPLPNGYGVAGFFATAYDLNGEVVISFRGTDPTTVNAELFKDIFEGWIASFGIAPSPQLAAAELFYENVTNLDLFTGASNVVLTGHSLGGGLAGYIGALNGTRAVVFDHMPFETAAVLRWLEENAARGLTNFATLLDGSSVPLVAAPDASAISGFHAKDEILEDARIALPFLAPLALSSVFGPFAIPIGTAAGALVLESPEFEFDSRRPLSGNTLDVTGQQVQLHSQALLVSLMFAEENLFTDWQSIGAPLIDAFYDKEIAEEVGFTVANISGYFDPATKLQTAIAYSVIDEGADEAQPFGHTAIRAWFDDANELGRAVNETAGVIQDLLPSLTKIITQYAGELAFHDDETDSHNSGVVTLAPDLSTLSVDLSQATWTFDGGLGGANDQTAKIIGRDEILNDIDTGGLFGAGTTDTKTAFDDLYGANGADRFGRLVFKLQDDGQPVTLPASANGNPIAFFAGTTGGDDVRDSATDDEVIYGGAGDDTLRSTGGNDLLAGGAGDDLLELGFNNSAAIGGSGKDVASIGHELTTVGPVVIDNIAVVNESGVTFDVHYDAGQTATHAAYQVETIAATGSADAALIADASLDAKIAIDLDLNGGTGRDLVDYSGLTHGINYYDGHTSERTGNVNRNGLTQLSSFGEELATVADATLRETTGSNLFNDGLVVKGAEHVILTDFDDSFIGAKPAPGEGALLLETGGGADKVWWTAGLGVTDLSLDDRVALFGAISLFGGGRNAASESEYVKGLGGLVEYGVNSLGQLEIHLPWMAKGFQGMFVLNWQESTNGGFTGAGGITLFEFEIRTGNFLKIDRTGGFSRQGTWDLFGLLKKATFGPEFGNNGSDPLVLDLDGDGFELTNRTSASPFFDIDDDGYLERTAFAKGDDGVLARDINGDGIINDAGELFGFGLNSGFSVLASLDGNGDGKVDAGDDALADFNGDGVIDAADQFSSLLVWRDLDRDAFSDAGELASVAAHGIQSFSLNVQSVNQAADGGNAITGLSTFTWSDGTTGEIADVRFRLDNANSIYAGPAITVTPEAAALPDLHNSGTLVTLHEALSVIPANVAAVQNTLATLTAPDLDLLAQQVRPILYAWVEGSPLKQADGTYLTGPEALTQNHDITMLRLGGETGVIADYNWGESEQTVSLGLVSMEETHWSFASGREFVALRAVGDPAAAIESFWELGADLSFSERLINVGGVVKIETTYLTDRGQTYVATRDATAPRLSETEVRSAFVDANGVELVEGDHNYFADHLTAADLAVQARYFGETLDVFYTPPGTLKGGIEAVTELVKSIDENFKLLAVRLAVQDGPLAPLFSSLNYNAATDKFEGTNGRQLQGVFTALFTEAELQADPLAWYGEWKDFLDVVIADFSRGGAHLQNTHGFLVQNIVTAIEAVNPSFSLIEAAAVVGVPPEVFKLGSGVVAGSGGADIFYLDASDQTLQGAGGLDTYIVGGTIGHDIIDDHERLGLDGRGNDLLRFSAHNSGDITASRVGIDLILTVTATGETITIKDQFDGQFPGIFGGDFSDDTGVREIIFADGEVWSDFEIAYAVSRIDAGGNVIVGTRETDVLEGGTGDDLLIGGGDADVYIFNPGDGSDVIHDQEDNNLRPGFDVLQIRGGVTADDLTFFRSGKSDDVTIGFTSSADTIKLQGQFNATETGFLGTWWLDRVEIVTFDDGTGLNYDDIMDLTIAANTTSGDDLIYGYSRSDRLDGGAGNDFLSGGNYNDSYVFGGGYGQDVVHDQYTNILTGRRDRVIFTSDVNPEDIIFIAPTSRSNDLQIQLAGSNDILTVIGQNGLTPTGPFGIIAFDEIEEFVFTDGSGTIWNANFMRRQALIAAATVGDDHIFGFTTSDTLDGGAGNDTLEGFGSSDTYIFGRGSGNDVISDLDENILLTNSDVVDFGSLTFAEVSVSRDRNDLIFTINDSGETLTLDGQYVRGIVGGQFKAVEEFRFADQTLTLVNLNPDDIDLVGTSGDDTLFGTAFAETFNAKEGDDLLQGGADGDTYIFGAGYGTDTIDDYQNIAVWNNDDTVWFTGEITQSNLVLSISGQDLVITISGQPDILVIKDQFGGAARGVERFEFADGSFWTEADVRQRVGLAGSGEGPDILFADPLNTILDGREGDDELHGHSGSDTYVFGVGYDRDSIFETADSTAQTDIVVLSQEITPESFTLVREGPDMVLKIFDSGDELRIVDAFNGKNVEEFRFADGTIWTSEQIKDKLLQSTDVDDQLFGFAARNDVLAGGLGDDALEGGTGDDVYRFNIGDGRDRVFDSGGAADAIEFGDYISLENVKFTVDGQTIVIAIDGFDDNLAIINGLDPAANRIEEFRFVDGRVISFEEMRGELLARQTTLGNDLIAGFDDRNDILAGGAGADALYGLGGDDAYQYSRGDGVDLIDDQGASTADRLVISGYLSTEASVRRLDPASSDAVIVLASGDEIIIRGALDEANASAIETIAFDDVAWTIADLRGAIIATQAGASDETIYGFVAPDTIAGGAGNDILVGGFGGDTYVFNRGDGVDVVTDAGDGIGDQIVIHGISPAEATVRRFGAGATDIEIDLGFGDRLILRGNLASAIADQIEKIVFDDGTIWSNADIKAFAVGGYALNGGSGADTLTSSALDDTLKGSTGNDSYVYDLGDGRDVIFDGDLQGTNDVLLLGPGILPSQVSIERGVTDIDDAILTFADGGTVVLDEEFSINRDATIDNILFADGTNWSRQDLQTMLIAAAATDGDDLVNGYPASDTLYGGLGDDTLVGRDGFDRYLFNVGDGHDYISETGFAARTDDRVVIGGYAFSDISRYSIAGEQYTFFFGSAGDAVTILNTSDVSRRIDFIDFVDVTKTIVELMAAAQTYVFDNALANASTTGDDSIVGSANAEKLTGGGGNDTLSGGDGSDRYVFNRGDGIDVIDDRGGADTDVLQISGYLPSEVTVQRALSGSGDFYFTFAGTNDVIRVIDGFEGNFQNQIEQVAFDDGTVWMPAQIAAFAAAQPLYQIVVSGDSTANTLSGSGGHFVLQGGLAGDTYVFTVGDGQDKIDDLGDGAGVDTLVIHGYAPTDLRLFNVGDTLHIRFAGSDDAIEINRTLSGFSPNQIEQIAFDDGSIWSAAQIRTELFADLKDAQSRTIDGTSFGDTIEGGPGDDTLHGKNGDDVYVFNAGDGVDFIEDQGVGFDRLVVNGFAPQDLILSNNGATLVINFAGSSDSITIDRTLSGFGASQIEEISFNNGATVWNLQQIRNELFADLNDSADRLIEATSFGDTIAGGLGNDSLHGNAGADVYDFSRGDGADVIEDNGGNETDRIAIHGYAPGEVILSTNGTDLVVQFAGEQDRIDVFGAVGSATADRIEEIAFDDGTLWDALKIRVEALAQAETAGEDDISAFLFDDTLSGGFGDDTLAGGDGSDVYRYRAGDGFDVIEDKGNGDVDRLEITGYDLTSARFSRLSLAANDLLISFGGGDAIVIVNALAGSAADTIEEIVFNGAVTSIGSISALIAAGQATNGDDILVGTANADSLAGGAGNDLIDGGAGADDFGYALGDGSDRIVDAASAGDRLLIHGVAAATVAVRRSPPNGNDLILTLSDGGEISIANGLAGGNAGVEQIVFDDATIWTPDQLMARIIAESASSGSDRIWGFSGTDTLQGSLGDDTLIGLTGGDTYQFSAGDGSDTIEDIGSDGVDRLEISSYASTEVGVSRLYLGSNDLVLTFVGSNDRIAILNTLDGSPEGTIEEFSFADGVVWTPAEIALMLANNAPVAGTDSLFPVRQGETTTIAAAALLANDFDADGDGFSIVAVKNAEQGSVSLDANGDIAFAIGAAFEGVATFEYTISDGEGGLTDGLVYVRVEPAVTTRDDAGITAIEDTALLIDAARLLANDVDGDRLSIAQVGGAVNGTVLLTTERNVVFTPNADFVGAAFFTYTANLPNGGVSTSTVTVSVISGNDAPVANPDSGFTLAEGGRLLIDARDLLVNDFDQDGDALSLASVGNTVGGTVALNSFGDVVFTASPDFFGIATFEYVAVDPNGGSATSRVSLNVTPVNDAPILVDDMGFSTNEDQQIAFAVGDLLANDSDPDGDPLTLTRIVVTNGGTASILPNNAIVFTPSANFFGTASFVYEASDGQGGLSFATVEIAVAPVNDAPTINNEQSADALSVVKDSVLTVDPGALLANDFDIDGDTLTISAVDNPVNGDVSFDANGQIVFTPAAGYSGLASFNYTVADGLGGINFGTAYVNVLGAPGSPPVANDDSGFAVDEDQSLTISAASILANDTDADGHSISLVSVTSRSSATVSIDANGDIIYTPEANFSGVERFEYRITDGVNGDSVAFIEVAVNEINDAPVAIDDTATTTLDAPLVIRISDLLANDGDVEDSTAALSITSITNVSAGAATIVNGEFIVVDAPLGFTGTLTFDYTLADTDGGIDVGLVTASVTTPAASTITGTTQRDLLLGSPGGETIIGLDGADTIEGRGGDDTLIGGLGADAVNGGAGFDIVDYSASNAGLRADLNARIGIGGHAQGDLYAAIEGIIGTDFADELYGDAGANMLVGGLSADTIGGAAGADTLEGGGDSDDYEFAAGFGADLLREGADAAALDRIIFASSIAAADVFIAADAANPGNLIVTHSPSGSKITVENHFAGGGEGVEQIVFSDGTIWDRAAIDAMAAFVRDPNQTIVGTSGADTLTGATGHDTLKGLAGSDDYVLVARHGNDVIKDVGTTSDVDKVFLDASIAPTDLELLRTSGNFGDLLLVNKVTGETVEIDRHFTTTGAEGVEEIHFGDGTVWDRAYLAANAETRGTAGNDSIIGTNDNERLRGGLGADTMNGKNGNDDYLIAAGDGDDVIDEFGLAGDIDRIVFDASVAPADLQILKSSSDFDDLFLINNATGETITVDQHFIGTTHGVEQIAFADGTIWDRAFIVANALMLGTSASELLRGDGDGERIRGGAGDDSLLGNGGSDDYLFGADDGADLVDEFGASMDIDRLIFDAGVNPTDILLTRGTGALATTVYVTNVVTGSVITIDQQRSSADLGVEEIRFADGTVWDRAAIETLSATGAPVVLDLDGDGVELRSSRTNGVRFDFDGDGRKERGGWVAPDDGILALDRNGDGKISGIAEISFLGDRAGARSDLEGLGAFDSNGDGILSSDDDAFLSFVVWRDRNSDGVSQKDELKSLSDLGVVSLSPVGAGLLNDGPVSLTDNSVLRTGVIEWANGQTTNFADVALRYQDEAKFQDLHDRFPEFFDRRDFWFPADHDRGREPFLPKFFERIGDPIHVMIDDFGDRQASEDADRAPIRKTIADFGDYLAIAETTPASIHKMIADPRGVSASDAASTNARDPAMLLKLVVRENEGGVEDAALAWREFVGRDAIDWSSFIGRNGLGDREIRFDIVHAYDDVGGAISDEAGAAREVIGPPLFGQLTGESEVPMLAHLAHIREHLGPVA